MENPASSGDTERGGSSEKIEVYRPADRLRSAPGRDRDDVGAFFYIPFSGLQSMVEVLRRRVVKLLMDQELLNEDFARNLLSARLWSCKHLRFQHRQQRSRPRQVRPGEPRRVHRATADLAEEDPLRTV